MIIIQPIGGLCNRMRAIGSAMILAEKRGEKVTVFWKVAPELGCPFEELFEKARANGDDVIYIPLSKELSGDFQTAVSVQNMVGYDRVYIIDTMSCGRTIKQKSCVMPTSR